MLHHATKMLDHAKIRSIMRTMLAHADVSDNRAGLLIKLERSGIFQAFSTQTGHGCPHSFF
jgi:hypothetical protein